MTHQHISVARSELLKQLIRGRTIFFLGAGFASLSSNRFGRLPMGDGLKNSIINSCCDDEEEKKEYQRQSLAEVAQYYMDEYPQQSMRFLREQFEVQEIDEAQRCLKKFKLKRIYTTNFDTTLEKIFGQTTSSYSVPSDDTRFNNEKIVYLHGSIKKFNYPRHIILPDASYDLDLFNRRIKDIFISDVKDASAIVFVGYSMFDRDIARIFASIEEKHKTFFIQPEGKEASAYPKLLRFGHVLPIGVDGMASILAEAKATMKDQPRVVIENRRHFQPDSPELKESPSGPSIMGEGLRGDRFNLFVKGAVTPQLFSSANNNKVIVERVDVGHYCDTIEKNKILLLHGFLASGKTITAMQIAHKMSLKGYQPLWAHGWEEASLSELRDIGKTDTKQLIIFESALVNKPFFKKILEIVETSKETTKFLATSRTWLLDSCTSLLRECSQRIPIQIEEISDLKQAEVIHFTSIFEDLGITFNKNEMLGKLDGKIYNILVKYLESDDILRRLQIKYEKSATKAELTKLAILTYLASDNGSSFNYALSREEKNNLLMDKNALEFCINPTGFVQFPNAALSAVFTSRVAAPEIILKSLIALYKDIYESLKNSSYMNKHDSASLKEIRVGLKRFAVLEKILPREGKRRLYTAYFEEIGQYDNNLKDPLYWLQYAMCIASLPGDDMEEQADHYFKAAFKHAARKKFHVFQIEDQYEKFKLERSQNKRTFDMALFESSYSVFKKHFNDSTIPNYEDRRERPFRLLNTLCKAITIHKMSFPEDELDVIRTGLREAYTFIDSLPLACQNKQEVTEFSNWYDAHSDSLAL